MGLVTTKYANADPVHIRWDIYILIIIVKRTAGNKDINSNLAQSGSVVADHQSCCGVL